MATIRHFGSPGFSRQPDVATFCTATTSSGFVSQLLADTDCQAFGMIERGYAALAQPGGTVSTALTGLLVIAVALFGYRLLLGRGIVLGDAVGLVVRIGIVLVLATSWESWQAVAYQGLAQAPAQIASDVLTATGSPPPLLSLQKALDDLTQAAVGYRSRAGIASPLVGGPAAAGAVLNLSVVVLTVSVVGVLVAARVIQAVLLAIAPAMAGLLLFDPTRGMAQGWLGAIAATALAPLFVLLMAAIEFAILSPMIARLLAEQASGTFENSSVMPIGLVVTVFVISSALGLRTVARIGYGLRLAGRRRSSQPSDVSVTERASTPQAEPVILSPQRTRLIQSLESLARRDAPVTSARTVFAPGTQRAASTARDQGRARSNETVPGTAPTYAPLPRAQRLQSGSRRSRAASRRDQ